LYGKDKEMMMIQSLERSEESASAHVRHLVQQGMVVAPFVYDGLQAKIAQQAGLQGVYMTGFGTAAAMHCR
jgi:2-methylisocitrate lyase-like PEP mutase family enzyme